MHRPLCLLLCLLPLSAASAAEVDVDAYIRKPLFERIEISPTGEYLAATVPLAQGTGLMVLRRKDNARVGAVGMGRDRHVVDFSWVSPERLVFNVADSRGALDTPLLDGKLHGVDFDGGRPETLIGNAEQAASASRLKAREPEDAFASLIDPLRDSDSHALVSISPWTQREPMTRVERIDVLTGRGVVVARVPVRRAGFAVDNAGVVRAATGADATNYSETFVRASEKGEWIQINDQEKTGRIENPIGFSADNSVLYLSVETGKGADAVVAYTMASGERRTLVQDDVDPWRYIYSTINSNEPIGAILMDGKARAIYFDEQSPEVQLHKSLSAAFPGQIVEFTSATADGNEILVQVGSDTSPGDFFIFDRRSKKATHLATNLDWFDPDAMAPMEPVALKARDGLDLHGYLTRPRGTTGPLPMVVLVHGGPYGTQDTWTFDGDVQMLAEAGYAVLQVNFRGSDGYGRAFEVAGARQWGRAMQDDLTDATRWAIEQGIADKQRICIVGASYGAYAAMMGLAREPDLYRCGVGYVGLYDLVRRHTDLSASSGSLASFAEDWMGPRSSLAAVSPINLAGQIKAPVFLAAGGEDRVTPVVHTRDMEKALKAAKVPVETLIVPSEGHGFYEGKNRYAYYSRLLEFLSRHLGGAKAKPSADKG